MSIGSLTDKLRNLAIALTYYVYSNFALSMFTLTQFLVYTVFRSHSFRKVDVKVRSLITTSCCSRMLTTGRWQKPNGGIVERDKFLYDYIEARISYIKAILLFVILSFITPVSSSSLSFHHSARSPNRERQQCGDLRLTGQ